MAGSKRFMKYLRTQSDSGGSEKKPKAKKQKVAATGGGGDKGGAPGGQTTKGGSKMAKDMLTSPVLSSGPESPTPGRLRGSLGFIL